MPCRETGIDDPENDLHIIQTAGDITAGIRLDMTNTSGHSAWVMRTIPGLFLSSSSDFYEHPLFFESVGDGSGGAGAIGSDGSYYKTSDARKKKDIHYLQDDNILPKILQLKPANYLMKADASGSPYHYGFIAQEVENIFPEFVLNIPGKAKLLSYESFIPVLTKGMQEQQEQIELLKRENAELKAGLERLGKIVLK